MKTTDRAESATSSGGIGVGSAQHAETFSAPLTPGRIGRPGNYSQWFAHQVQYLRSVADEDRRWRYLNGIEYVYGVAVRNRVEAEVARLGPAEVMRHTRDHSNGHGRRAA